MNSLLEIIVCAALFVNAGCFDSSHHRHRHSRSHLEEYNFDKLLNHLDAQTTSKPPEVTDRKSLFDELDEPGPVQGNSLWNGGSSELSITQSPLDIKRWDKILKKKEKNKDKKVEEVENVEDDQGEDNEDELDDQKEQADYNYRPWSPRGSGSFSNWKWENLGSQKSVDGLFQDYKTGAYSVGDKDQAIEAYRHTKQMARETLCRWPRSKVIRVADVYGSSGKSYVPACTVLHRCTDDTGCCNGSLTCGPKTTKRVELYFHVSYIMGSHNQQRTKNGIEKLYFYNHTECECVNRKEEVMPRDVDAVGDFRAERITDQNCRCPSEYSVRRLSNGSCICDCFDKQRDCIKYKRGNEYFNHSDKTCIEMGTCQYPSCYFGMYQRNHGRCPRKLEKFHTWPRRRY